VRFVGPGRILEKGQVYLMPLAPARAVLMVLFMYCLLCMLHCALLTLCLQGCPQDTFKTYWTLRRHAVPIGRNVELEAVCEAALAAVLGPLAVQYQSAQLSSHPEVLGIAAVAVQDGGLPGSQNLGVQHGSVRHEQPPDPTPVVAWVVPKKQTGYWSSFSVQQLLQAAVAALHWTQQHVQEFPLLAETAVHDSAQKHGQQDNTDTNSGPLGALPGQQVG